MVARTSVLFIALLLLVVVILHATSAYDDDSLEYCGLLSAPHGISKDWARYVPEDYFSLLCRINANWLG